MKQSYVVVLGLLIAAASVYAARVHARWKGIRSSLKLYGFVAPALMLLLCGIACSDAPPSPEQVGRIRSAAMLGATGIPGRSDQFVRSSGVLFWRYTEGLYNLVSSQHDYVWEGYLTAPLVSDPAAASWGTGRSDVFVINQNNTIDHGLIDPYTGGTFSWWDNWGSPAPGQALTGIAVTSGRSGLLDVFVVDVVSNGTNNLYHRRWDNGADTGWVLLSAAGAMGGPSYFGPPAAVGGGSNGPESIDVFVTATNTGSGRPNIYHLSSPNGGGTVFNWENLGEPFTSISSPAALSSHPGAASWSNGRMDVLVTDNTGVMRHLYTGTCAVNAYGGCYRYNWGWDTWPSPPVSFAPAVVAMGPSKLRIFARLASNGSLEECDWDNADLGCTNRSGYIDGGPSASSWGLQACTSSAGCAAPLVCVDNVCVPGLSAVTSSCNDAATSTNDTWTLHTNAIWGGASAFLTQTSTSVGSSSPSTTTSITLGGQVVRTELVTGPDASGHTTVSADFGSAFHGIHHIDATTDGVTVNEVIDGRSLKPFPAASGSSLIQNPPPLVFLDGLPPPTITVDPGTFEMIAAITSKAGLATPLCNRSASLPVAQLPDTIGSQPGHQTNVDSLASCTNCVGPCNQIQAECIYGAAVGCGGAGAALSAIPLLGIGVAAACDAIADAICISTGNGCRSGCHNIGSGCCPQACGGGCCAQSEQCLDTGASSCCSAGFDPCKGPKESCVNTQLDVCLPSGQGCGIGVPTCGSGVFQICCPSGNCSGNTCIPGPSFGIKATATGTQTGPDICVSGQGFTPHAPIVVRYLNIPVPGGGVTTSVSNRTAIVDDRGTFNLGKDTSQDMNDRSCSQTQAFGQVTVQVIDGTKGVDGTGAIATTTLPASMWCANFPGPGTVSGGCQ